MIDKQTEELISKFFANQITKVELQRLSLWLEHDRNKILFQEYVDVNYVLEQSKRVNLINKEIVWRSISTKVRKGKTKLFYVKYAVAAAIMLLLALPFVFNNKNNTNNTTIVNNNIKIGTEKAILTLEDGSNIVLEKEQNYTTEDLTSNAGEIVYKNDSKNISESEIKYNYLMVPRGGIHSVVLSDGTKVWLNSDSKIKYPVAFAKDQTRTVDLIYGEAYFDVSPSTNHNGAGFIVKTKFQEIEVLGTEFNIKAYSDDDAIYSTLIEGEVSVSNGEDKAKLDPGQQSIIRLDSEEKAINVFEADLNSETAWMRGVFSFKYNSLKDISKVLSRWYNVDITIENQNIKDVRFKAQLSKKQNIEDILKLIKNQNYINDYIIEENQIIIK